MTRRLGQSLVTTLIVAIAVAVVVAACGAYASVATGIRLSEERLGADIMVLPSAAGANASEVLFTAQPMNVYLPASSLEAARGVSGVERISPQFFTQTVDESCCSVIGITRVVGIDSATDFTVSPWFDGNNPLELSDDQIVVGAAAPPIEGGQASILGSVFQSVGTLAPTGTSVDETIFMDIESARAIAASSPYLEAVWHDADPFDAISCLMVEVDPSADPDSVAVELMEACPGSIAVQTSDMVSGVSDQLSAMASICLILLVALVVLAGLALAGRMGAIASARMREMGLMRTLGAGRGAVSRYLVCETGITALTGALIGIIVGCICSGLCVSLMHSTFNLPGAAPSVMNYLGAAGIGLAFAIVLDGICLLPTWHRIHVSDPLDVLAKGGV